MTRVMLTRRLGCSGADAGAERHVAPTEGGVQQHPLPCVAVAVRVFRSSPSDPNRASGEGQDGSDPHFFAAGAARQGGGATPGATPSPRHVGVAPVHMYPCGKAPMPTDARERTCRRAVR